MSDWRIKERFLQLSKNGKTRSENNRDLLQEYYQDKINGIATDKSEARTLLVLTNESLIKYVLAIKFNLNGVCEDFDEYTECKLGLIKAIDNFDISKGVEFSTYAIKVMQNELYMYYRKLKNSANLADYEKISIEECMMEKYCGEPKPQFAHNFSTDADFLADIFNEELIRQVLTNFIHLTPLEQKVLVYTFGLFNNKRLKQREIAVIINKSRGMVSKLLNTAIKKLQVLSMDEDNLTPNQLKLKHQLQNEVHQCNIQDVEVDINI